MNVNFNIVNLLADPWPLRWAVSIFTCDEIMSAVQLLVQSATIYFLTAKRRIIFLLPMYGMDAHFILYVFACQFGYLTRFLISE